MVVHFLRDLGATLRGFLGMDLQAIVEHNAIQILGLRAAHVAFPHILGHPLGVALQGVAESATAT
jgi:hypothetical protein